MTGCCHLLSRRQNVTDTRTQVHMYKHPHHIPASEICCRSLRISLSRVVTSPTNQTRPGSNVATSADVHTMNCHRMHRQTQQPNMHAKSPKDYTVFQPVSASSRFLMHLSINSTRGRRTISCKCLLFPREQRICR